MPITGIPATTVDPVASLVTALEDATAALSAASALSLLKASNLSDVASAGTSRTNLGLGTSAVMSTAQIAADSALTGTFLRFTGDIRSAVRAVLPRLADRMAPPFATLSADAPTVTVGTSTTVNGRVIGPQTGVVTEVGSRGTWNATFGRLPASGLAGLDFVYTGLAVEIGFVSGATGTQQCWVFVDGLPVTATVDTTSIGSVTSSTTYYVKLTWGSAKKRRIEFFCPHSGSWFTIRASVGDSVEPGPRKPVVAFVSDSFWGGSNASTGLQVGAFALARQLGVECFNQSVSGTGYSTSNGFGSAARVTAVSAASPELILIQGSTNDDGASGLQASATAAYAAYAAALPNTPIVVFGRPPNSATATIAANSAANVAAVQAAARASSNVVAFHDMIGVGSGVPSVWSSSATNTDGDLRTYKGSVYRRDDPGGTPAVDATVPDINRKWRLVTWAFTGTGQVGTTTGDGTRDTYLYSDGVHPTVDAQDALAATQATRLRSSLLTYASTGTQVVGT